MKKHAFTLIELLVVITIVALLLAIITPALRKAKEYAKRVICSSNSRQTGLALGVYAENNDGKVVPLTRPDGGSTNNAMAHWGVVAFNPNYMDLSGMMIPLHLGILYREGLIETAEVFYCPAQPRNPNYPIPYNYDAYTKNDTVEWGTETYQNPGFGADYTRTSYNYWTYYETHLGNIGSYRPILIDNVQEWEVVPHRKGSATSDTVPQGLSALFGDGHVAFCTNENLWSDYTWNDKNSADGSYGDGPGNDNVAFERILRALQGK